MSFERFSVPLSFPYQEQHSYECDGQNQVAHNRIFEFRNKVSGRFLFMSEWSAFATEPAGVLFFLVLTCDEVIWSELMFCEEGYVHAYLFLGGLFTTTQ